MVFHTIDSGTPERPSKDSSNIKISILTIETFYELSELNVSRAGFWERLAP